MSKYVIHYSKEASYFFHYLPWASKMGLTFNSNQNLTNKDFMNAFVSQFRCKKKELHNGPIAKWNFDYAQYVYW